MKQILFLVIPCVLAFVLVNAQTGFQTGFGAGQQQLVYNYVRRVPGRAVYYPYPVPGPQRRPSIVGPIINAINQENQQAFLATALATGLLALLLSNTTGLISG